MQTCVFALSHKHWRLHVARHVASACRDMARLQPGPEQPFPTVWDDAGREVLDRAPPFLALADSTFQGLLRIQGGKRASYGFPSLGADSGYAVVCPGSSLIKAAPPRPSILQALSMAACTALLPDASLSLYKVEADPDFLAFLRQHIDSPIRVGLVPCGNSLPPSQQTRFDYVQKARQDFNLGEHEFPWSIMDLNEPGFQLYGTKDQLHFAPGSQLQAIGRIIGRSLYHMTVVQPSSELQGTARSASRGTAPETPSFQPFAGTASSAGQLSPGGAVPLTPPPFLPVILCCSWNAPAAAIHEEMLATQALVRAKTLRDLIVASAYHAGMKVTLPYALAVRPGESLYGSLPVPQRLFQTFIHDNFQPPKDMAKKYFPDFKRDFYDDQACASVVKSVAGGAGQRLLSKLASNAHRADVFRYAEHWLRGGFYMDIKTVLIVPPRTLHAHAVSDWKANPQLSSIAAHEYDWDESLLVQSGPPDYFLTAIGEKKDHIFQGILMGRQQHPLMLAALKHALQRKYVDSSGQIKETYLFCRALFDVIFNDLIAADILNPPPKTPTATPGVANRRRLNPGWHLTFTMGPIYLLQEVLESGIRQYPDAPRNEGHGFRTAQGVLVSLTRCWGWNHGWKADPASARATQDAMLRQLPQALHEAQAAKEAQAARSKGGTSSTAPPSNYDEAPTATSIQDHVYAALNDNLLEKIIEVIDRWPQYYGDIDQRQVPELIPKGLGICQADFGDALCCAFCTSKKTAGPVIFSTSQGLMQHFLRVKGGGSTWHHAGQQAYLQEEAARQAQHGTAASSSQAPPEPKAPPSRPAPSTPAPASDPRASSTRLPQAVPAPPPKLMDAPHRSTLPPKEPDQAPPTMEDLCAEKDFFDWIVDCQRGHRRSPAIRVRDHLEYPPAGSEEASPLAPWTANTSTKQRRP